MFYIHICLSHNMSMYHINRVGENFLFYFLNFIYSIMDHCEDCDDLYVCDKCVPNRFLEESRVIGCNKKFDELSSDEKSQFQFYGICPDCKEMNTGRGWCNKCDPGRFLREGMTSGNAEMDKLIHDAQLQTLDYSN